MYGDKTELKKNKKIELPFKLHNDLRFSRSNIPNELFVSECAPYSNDNVMASSPGPYKKCGSIFIKQKITIVTKPLKIKMK